jgi:hypothetical protein
MLPELGHYYRSLFYVGRIARAALLSRCVMVAAMLLADSALPDFDATATHLSDLPCRGEGQVILTFSKPSPNQGY